MEKRVADTFYTQEVEGETAIRAIYNPAITHPWAHFSKNVVSFSVDFFDKALGAPNALAGNDQIWQYKAAFNGVGIVGFFLFVAAAALAMLDLPCFAELKAETPVQPWPAPEGKAKKRYWRNSILSAVLSILFYFVAFIVGYMLWQSEIWNQGASRIIGLWSLLCGICTWLMMRSKKYPVDKVERGIKLGKG
jgi:hypothetical protein